MKKLVFSVFLTFVLMCSTCLALVPHRVGKYGFSMQLPDTFTHLVEQENIGQRMYEGYMGSPESKSFVHVWIAKQIYEEDYVGKRLEYQLAKTVDVYKKQGAEIISTEVVKLTPHEGFIIHSKHDGAEFLTLMVYHDCVMYVVSANIAKGDKYGVKEFYPMLMSVRCKLA